MGHFGIMVLMLFFLSNHTKCSTYTVLLHVEVPLFLNEGMRYFVLPLITHWVMQCSPYQAVTGKIYCLKQQPATVFTARDLLRVY